MAQAAEPVPAVLAIGLDPAADGAGIDAEEAGHVGLRPTLVDAFHREHAAVFQILEGACRIHAPCYGYSARHPKRIEKNRQEL